MNTLTFDISDLAKSKTGQTQTFSFDGQVDFEDLKLTKSLSGKTEIMRLEEGFNIVATEIKGECEADCEKCLSTFNQPINLESAERIFYFEDPGDIIDINDIFLVDTKNQKIDLTEMIRQEIILHFPPIQVCSTGCKGICAHCGANKNKKNCNCKDLILDPKDNKPLSALKDLIK